MYWLSQVLTESKYYGPNTAAEAVSKLFKPEERPQKIILDIGAGTGLVAEEVICMAVLFGVVFLTSCQYDSSLLFTCISENCVFLRFLYTF